TRTAAVHCDRSMEAGVLPGLPSSSRYRDHGDSSMAGTAGPAAAGAPAACDNDRGGAGQTVASPAMVPRKVRAPQGTVPGNAWAARADGKCNRKIPPKTASAGRQG